MKRSFLLLLMLLSTVFTSQSSTAKSSTIDKISEHFYTKLVSESESHNMAFFASPLNDNCDQAKSLDVSASKDCSKFNDISLNGATSSNNNLSSCDTSTKIVNANDVWYKFTANGTKHGFTVSDVTNVASGKNVHMVVYRTKSTSNSDVFGCNQTVAIKPFGVPASVVNCGFNFNASKTTTISGFVKGQEYYVRFYTDGVSDAAFKLCITTPPAPLFVSPSGERYTVDGLIRDVLVQAEGCDLVSDVTYQVGNGTPQTKKYNTLGYFNKNGSDFPFEEGIVLSTTEVVFTPGPYKPNNGNRGLNDERWTGDKDLNDAIAAGGGAPYSKFRSTQIEFKFRPVKDSISFEYLFASNSYHKNCGEVCGNGAMFAAWLIDPDGKGQNLALVPNTTATPISINTVRNASKSGAACASVNEKYFGKYYGDILLNPEELAEDAPIDYVGLTKAMKSKTVKVIPGKQYRIKLAVMDFCPTVEHNSAVFFNAGSFDIGKPTLGESKTLEDGNAICAGDSYTIGNDIDANYYNVSWYKDDNIKPIPNQTGGTLVVTSPGKYKAKLEYKDVKDCETTLGPIQIDFYDEIIINKDNISLDVCMSNGPSTTVDLLKAVEGMTFSDVEYSFYIDEDQAIKGKDDGGEFIDSNYAFDNSANNVTNKRTIFVRLQQIGTPCFKVAKLEVYLNKCAVAIALLPDMHQCEVPGSVNYIFDLSQYDSKAGYGVNGVVVSYFKTQQDADKNTNAITNKTAYDGKNNEVIWVRVFDPSISKFATTSFKLYIDEVPKINSKLTPYTVCKVINATTGSFVLATKDNEIVQSKSGFSVEYYEKEVDALNGTIAKKLDKDNVYVSGNKVIYYRIVSQKSGCASVGNLELKLQDTLEATGTNIFYNCSTDGFALFNLNAIAASVINGNSQITSFSFYRYESDANTGINKIPVGPNYKNVIPGEEVIYIKVEGSGYCSNILPITLKVTQRPALSDPTPILVCKTPAGSVPLIDLTTKESEVLAGLDKSTLQIRYYTNYANAVSGSTFGEIANPKQHSIVNGYSVYVRVETGGSIDCYSIVEIQIIVNELPIINTPKDFEMCDDIDNDGQATFNLQSKKDEIDNSGYTIITFFDTEENAKLGKDKLDENAYVNSVKYFQKIWFRVEDTKLGCFVVGSFNLKVNEYPKFDSSKGGTLSACSSSENGQATFNLSAGTVFGIDNPSKYNITFYVNKKDAELGNEDNIRNPEAYTNLSVANPKVYIRIVNKETGCTGVYEINLIVNNAPKAVGELPLLKACDNLGDPFDYKARIDLTIYEAKILSGVDNNNDGNVYYYTEKKDANAHTNYLTDPKNYLNKSQKETIYYRVVDAVTGCYTIGEFNIEVQVGIRLIAPEPIVKCSDLSLGQNRAKFDLTVNNNAIINNIVDYGIDFKYYESEADAKAGINAIPQNSVKQYQNKQDTQSIWVVVTGDNGCSSTIVQTIKADAMPEPNLKPDAVVTCEGDTAGEGFFNLAVADFNIGGNDPNLNITYYASMADAQMDKDPLDKTLTSASKTIFAKVVNTKSIAVPSCFVIVSIDLKVADKPALRQDLHYTFCLNDSPLPPTQEFVLKTQDAQVLDGRNPSDFNVSYFKTEADAKNGNPKLPAIYKNETPTKQVIYVRLEDKKTKCVNIGKMVLSIEKMVTVTKPKDIMIECDNDGVSDGSTTFNLRNNDKEIVGSQTGVVVTYYASENDYLSNTPIVDPTKYKNVSNPQTIIAVVTSAAKDMFCNAVTSFVIQVQAVPARASIISNGSASEAFVCFNQDTNAFAPILIESGLPASQFDFTWLKNSSSFNAPNQPYLSVTEAGSYSLIIQFKNRIKNNCFSISSNVITVRVGDKLDIAIKGQDSTGMVGSLEDNDGTVDIHIEKPVNVYSSTGALITEYEYALNDGIYQDSRSFYNVSNGTHKIWVRESKGAGKFCAQYKEFFVLGYPKYFTPNGDGYNDTWNIPSLKGHPEAVIYIFDRYGKLLKQISPRDTGWDGTFNGKMMPSTDYWFTVEYQTDGLPSRKVSYKGHFSLKR